MYKSYDELPLFLNAATGAKLLGVSISSMYELMHEKGFPVLRIGSRLVIPKEKLQVWLDKGYEVSGVEVSYVLAWRPKEADTDYAVCLANVVLKR